MGWVARALAGPTLWAVLFSVVYALHGTGCNLGWTDRSVLFTDLHHAAMWVAWGLGLVLHGALVVTMPKGQEGRRRWIIVAGAWIGLVSSVFTLFPVIATSTCF
ncbi:hypothetical protein D3P06_08830 [Paracoccus aestuarii]|uniref:Uncharacterized protein n=1 Tax=Paracoccus aestuarii TaxID=453842 RepID=A0A418ZWK3_9RHOB|nr:hypothetical protein [Paracoccus aestuarii]RJL04872.1 hypothetical protein D3P06_08830 [Paracoccus aestuarii]WCQ98105.1 hypothetical protein JHW48_09035 [Paracoccus aestuarii]